MKFFTLFIVLAFKLFSHDLQILIKNVDNSLNGELKVAIFNSENTFIIEPFKTLSIKSIDNEMKITFSNLEKDFYSVAIFHDENSNGVLDKNIFSIPKEGYGFSNNLRNLFRQPNFEECKIYLEKDLNIDIYMNY